MHDLAGGGPESQLGHRCPNKHEKHDVFDVVGVGDGELATGGVRKKSNHTPLDRAATIPPSRSPLAAMTTTKRTRIAVAFVTWRRTGAITAASTRGITATAKMKHASAVRVSRARVPRSAPLAATIAA